MLLKRVGGICCWESSSGTIVGYSLEILFEEMLLRSIQIGNTKMLYGGCGTEGRVDLFQLPRNCKQM